MNKTLWKLEHISERLWLIASSLAMEAGRWGHYGRGFAVVAEESRNASIRISNSLENVLFDEKEIDQPYLSNMATQLSYLALNCAIEAQRSWEKGKAAAVCAEEIRNLVIELTELLDSKNRRESCPPPLAKNVMTSIDDRACFMQFHIDGYRLVENINFIEEVVTCSKAINGGTHIQLRSLEIPIIDCYSILGKKRENFYVILRTPWAKTNELYAVVIDELNVGALSYSPVGVPVYPVPNMPLSQYVRECWESTDSEPFRFMDWNKIYQEQVIVK